MQKIIKEMNDGIIQITVADERWYVKNVIDKKDKKVSTLFVPSVTWITSYYPKGIAYFKWLANHGWDESESIKNEAGDKGSKVHYAIEDLLKGQTVKMTDKYINGTSGEPEELTLDEWNCIVSFSSWYKEVKPEVVSTEITVFNDDIGYAGTVDLVCKIDGKPFIVDFKTSQYIWPSHELQISAYKHGDVNLKDCKLAILQVGYQRNKKNFKFTEIEDKFDLFLSAKKIWQNECENVEPKKRDYPMELKLVDTKEEKTIIK
jgi:hypothetical protein